MRGRCSGPLQRRRLAGSLYSERLTLPVSIVKESKASLALRSQLLCVAAVAGAVAEGGKVDRLLAKESTCLCQWLRGGHPAGSQATSCTY